MAVYRVQYRDEAVEDFLAMPANLVKRIRRAEEERLAVAPDQYGSRLRDDLIGLWKIRVGDYRVVYEINHQARSVTVWGVRQRKGAYQALSRRWLSGRPAR